MPFSPQELLYEGKAKRIYRTADPRVIFANTKTTPRPSTPKSGDPSPARER
jgi:hypothetical protein